MEIFIGKPSLDGMDGTFCQLVLYIQGIKLLSATVNHGSHKLYSTFFDFYRFETLLSL